MNAVEIESAVSDLAAQPFDAAEFPYQFLAAYDNKETTLAKLRSGSTNKSDVKGAVLQRNNIHILVTEPGKVEAGLISLKLSPATTKHKCEFVLATDGVLFQAEHLPSGELVACEYPQFPDHFGFFLPLAGISTVQSIRENSFDIKAIGRLNRLYMELLRENPEWKEGSLRHEMNRFLVRLVFCFYAEDTNIFGDPHLFSETVEMLTGRGTENTHEVIAEIFRAMSLKEKERGELEEPLPRWAAKFPYVNGGLFSDAGTVPKFSRVARSYLVQIGNLDWKMVNPDIFGSMIQGVANDAERSNLGMHYTSVPNILKVLNPLFLDDLRQAFEEAKGNSRKLLNLKNRLSHIRVFDPACGSGNFLLIAYKQLREIEHQINVERGEPNAASVIPITNFRGIEIQDFAAEVARLSLVIAEFQCNSLYFGQTIAASCFLPLAKKNWIVCGNSLRLDWMEICPPDGTGVKLSSDDLFSTPLGQTEIDFENEGGEIYICGNPPFVGKKGQSSEQKIDLGVVCESRIGKWRSLDYVSGWFVKGMDYISRADRSRCAFVATNSICQGGSVGILWKYLLGVGAEIEFAYTSFKWNNLASKNAGVSCVIVCIGRQTAGDKLIFTHKEGSIDCDVKIVKNITPYLEESGNIIVDRESDPLSPEIPRMSFGNMPYDNNNLLLTRREIDYLGLSSVSRGLLIKRLVGSKEFCQGIVRYCLWIDNENLEAALENEEIARRIGAVKEFRLKAALNSRSSKSPEGDSTILRLATRPHQFREMHRCKVRTIVVPAVSSEGRPYLPCGMLDSGSIVINSAFAIYDAPVWCLALIASRLHLVWVKTVCGKLETRFRYSNTLGWHTFPIPKLTTQNKEDLTRAAERILEARERHFPATIAELYDGENMPDDLRQAHEWNDGVVESIFIGRRFKNDSERLERLYDMYAKLIAKKEAEN
ncbi:DNA methyltransferase [uncultured Sutterella sp.]|uniref:class I SAM-dependent DNA methyltransferase n=1 Tax=uncultured Sutterella sp. TaxID=286133 RepID=UPI0025FCC3E3|nr:DNA methyltransferase [uncultured Sutterella sp.]